MKAVACKVGGAMPDVSLPGSEPAYWQIMEWAARMPKRAIGDRACRIHLLREAHAVLTRRHAEQGPD